MQACADASLAQVLQTDNTNTELLNSLMAQGTPLQLVTIIILVALAEMDKVVQTLVVAPVMVMAIILNLIRPIRDLKEMIRCST